MVTRVTAMTDPCERLVRLVELWHRTCTDFVAFARDLPAAVWEEPTDLAGWTVKDNVAHLAHLESVLAGGPEETVQVEPAPHLTSAAHLYTEQGVAARRDRDLPSVLDELEQAVETRYAALRANPPTEPTAPAPHTPAGSGWDNQTLLTNRPLDVWMHEQDVRRATGRPGGFDVPAADHVVGLLARSLPMVVGKRVAPPPGTTVRLVIAERSWTVAVGEDGRALPTDDDGVATTTVTLSPEDFVVLAGGRRTPDRTDPVVAGDQELAHRLLASLTVTP